MHGQDNEKDLVFSLVKADLNQRLRSFGAQLPGPTNNRQETILQLLEENDRNFHIFYNDKNFHNHTVHHLLTAYVLGASTDRIKEIYTDSTSYQRPKPPSKTPITEENWTQYLGQPNMWTDYLEFFEKAVERDGIDGAFNKYGFHPAMYGRLYEGEFHPIIHIGYGFEFRIPLIVAEGLAEGAVHPNRFGEVLSDDYLSSKGLQNKRILEIFEDCRKEKKFNGFVTFAENFAKRVPKIVSDKEQMAKIRDYASNWFVGETEEEVKKAAQELYDAIVVVYGSTAIRPDREIYRPDFFFMHGVTSMFVVFNMLPYLSLEKQIKLLKGEFSNFLVFYVAQGRPELNIDDLKNYKPKEDPEPNPWLYVVNVSLKEKVDPHVMKTIRSIMRVDEELGPRKDDLYLKAAQLTIEGFHQAGWDFNGIGFDEEWNPEAIKETIHFNSIVFSKNV